MRTSLSSVMLCGAAALVLSTNCHRNPHFMGLQISEVRYVQAIAGADGTYGAFVELRGPAGMSVGGLELRIFRGDALLRSHALPDGLTIPPDGFLLISNTATVKASDRTTDVAVDHRVGYEGADWLPSAPDSGVTIVLDDPSVDGVDPEVVDSVRYNPSGARVMSWWEATPSPERGVGEGAPAPGLPVASHGDPAWGLSRIGQVDLDSNASDFLVASVTPGTTNEELWYDDGTRLLAVLRPRLNEVMPNTNGFNDENSFVELWGAAGQLWSAGPGLYELIAVNGASAPGGQRNWLALNGQIPESGYFVAADSPKLSEQFGGATPTQQVRCSDLHLSASACQGAGASEWDWLGNYQDAGIKLEYWITPTRRIVVDSLRYSPANPDETSNAFRHGEGLAPVEPSSPATSFSRFGADRHFNRSEFQHADPTPGSENARPLSTGSLVSCYGAYFTQLGVAPPSANGKTVLFDQTKLQKAGKTGHWIVTESGDYTDWAWQLYHLGYQIRAKGTGNTGVVETLEPTDLADVHVLVIAEPQAPYTTDERAAIVRYLEAGGSLFFIANHKDSDRDGNGWDAWRIYQESLDLDALTGVVLADAKTMSENVVAHATAAAAGHPILTDIETPSCAGGSAGCSLTGSILVRPPGVGIFSGSFMRTAETLPAGVAEITRLIEGVRPAIGRDPDRLAGYGSASPVESFAVAVQTRWGGGSGGRIVVLGDSAVLNDGGSSDYATYAASMAYNAYGTGFRNALFGVNVINWLAGAAVAPATSLKPSLRPAP
jgi:hypothetical protein